MKQELSFKTTMTFDYGVPSPIGPGIVRIVANNPSPLTFKGTNSYLVGMMELAIVDPGPNDPAHLAALLKAANGRRITHILVTHAHRDHVDGALTLQAETGAKIYGFGRESFAASGPAVHPQGSEFIDYLFKPDVTVGASDVIEGRDWKMTALHTPGHAPDHLCYSLAGRSVLFSGDHVMAWNTTLVAPPEGSMADYIDSLELLFTRPESLYLPGHGGRVDEPVRTVKAYLLHRRWREVAILDAIRGGAGTITAVVPVVYPTLDSKLQPAAMLSVQAHVEHLIDRGLVVCEGNLAFDRPLSAT